MKTIRLFTGLLVLGLLCLSGIAAAQEETLLTDDIEPYDGPIGAHSPLYGLKHALEDMDESFTANETERVNKQMNHAQLRLAEVRRSLELNQGESAGTALNNYWLKMDLANTTLSRWSSNATGLLHAQEQIVRHQFVLENLLAGNPNNTGLQRAYSNSLRLEERFAEKTMMKIQRSINKNNQTIMKAIRLETKTMDRTGWPDADGGETVAQPDDKLKGWEKEKGNNPVTTDTTTAPAGGQTQGQGNTAGTENPVTTVTTAAPSGDQGQQPAGSGNGNSADKGKGNSRK
jgi:hypothetical protein